MSLHDNQKKIQQRIVQLYNRLTNESITQEELEEFYALVSKHENTINPQLAETWEKTSNPDIDQELSREIRYTQQLVSKKSARIRSLKWWSGVAAGFLVLIFALIALNRDRSTTFYATGFGEREMILLPDGSSVELNANSTMSWDNEWEKTGVRQVRLTGEAFFEVTHLDQNQKFRVSTPDLNIEVLGTSFNVLNRNTNTEVFLREGKVKLGFEGNRSRADTLIMLPGQKISYSKMVDQVINDTENDPDKEASWKNGVLYFEDKSVAEILEEVSQVYGIEYIIPDADLAQKKMNFGVPYSDWETTREAFELTMGLQMTLVNGKYVVQK